MPKNNNKPIAIEVIGTVEAEALLQKIQGRGPKMEMGAMVIEACRNLGKGSHVKFHVPKRKGNQAKAGRNLTSHLNARLRKAKVPYRLRYVSAENVCVSEPWKW